MSTDLETPSEKNEYPKAPATEAVISIHFTAIRHRVFESFFQKRRTKYPHKHDVQEVSVQIKPDAEPTSDVKKTGIRLINQNSDRTVTLIEEQIATSHAPPYTKWENLYADAIENFEILDEIVDRVNVTKLSTRFINRIDIPLSDIGSNLNMQKYFNVGLYLPETVVRQGTVQNFQMSFGFKGNQESCPYEASIQLGLCPPALIDHMSVLLDIDTITTQPIPKRKDDMWVLLEGLRNQKNHFFEECITDDTRKFFR